LQKRAILLQTSIRVKSNHFDEFARTLSAISEDTIRKVCERVASGDLVTAETEDEKRVLCLMQEVNVISSNVPCSAASRVAMRNEIRGLVMEKGLPTFYLTINPADVHNPIV
ncbi:hypothetical protein BDN70DRAFT_775626, partial [Pholiota conissans]